VGEGRAGKTAWLRSVSNKAFEDTTSTIGVKQSFLEVNKVDMETKWEGGWSVVEEGTLIMKADEAMTRLAAEIAVMEPQVYMHDPPQVGTDRVDPSAEDVAEVHRLLAEQRTVNQAIQSQLQEALVGKSVVQTRPFFSLFSGENNARKAYGNYRMKASENNTRKEFMAFFNLADQDKDGHISKEEWGILGFPVVPFDWIDKDGDGFISRREFEGSFELVNAFREQEAGRCRPLCLLLRAKYEAAKWDRPVVMLLRLGLLLETAVGAEGTDKRATFEKDLSQDLAYASGLSPTSFSVNRVLPQWTNGLQRSMIAVVDIHLSSVVKNAVADDLTRQAGQVGSRLRSGKLSQTLESICFPTLEPGPRPMLPVGSVAISVVPVISEEPMNTNTGQPPHSDSEPETKELQSDPILSAEPDEPSVESEDRFCARELQLADSTMSAAGLRTCIGLDDDSLLGNMMQDPLHTIEMEFLIAGSVDDHDNFYSIKDGESGKWEDIPDHVKCDMAKGTYAGGDFDPEDYDTGNAGKKLHDFHQDRLCIMAGLMIYHVLVLRLFSISYRLFNAPLRRLMCYGASRSHPLRFTVYILSEALKKLRVIGALLDPLGFNTQKYLWRGMPNMIVDVTGSFMLHGGCELAVMSTTEDKKVAMNYARSRYPLVFRYKTVGLNRGVNIRFLSLYPKEHETIFPPFTFLIAEGNIYEEDGIRILDVTPQIS
jgi:hypothetical protein